MIGHLLVVCAGNICRSPMAAALLAARLDCVSVESAGLTALVGHQADPLAIDLMAERDVDIRPHRARQLVTWMAAAADLVLVMDRLQKQHLEERFAFLRGRVYRIGDASSLSLQSHAGFDIPDPYRKGRASFEESLNFIDAAVDGWSTRIAGLSAKTAAPQAV